MKSLVPVIVLITLALVGCGKTTETPSAAAPDTASLGQNLVGADYSVTFPKDWLVIDMKKMDVAAIEKKLKGTDFADSFINIKGFVGAEMFRAFAFIPEFSTKLHKANLNVIALPAGGDATSVLDANEKQMKSMSPKCQVLKDFTTVPESRSFIWDMNGVKTLSLVSVQNGKQYVLTMSVPESIDDAKAKAAAQPVFNSFVAK